MAIVSDQHWLLLQEKYKILDPFIDHQVQDGVISYGLSAAGYDLRLGDTVLYFSNSLGEIVDPKRMRQSPEYQDRLFTPLTGIPDGERVLLPPHSYILGYTKEYIRMPRELKGRVVGKSTWARCGVIVNTTPLEPGWEGHLTLEIANATPCHVALYVGEGIGQLELEMLTMPPLVDYSQKGGKYQSQKAQPIPGFVKEVKDG